MNPIAIPSERTIESISNHSIVEILNFGKGAPPYAWCFVPSQVEEAKLGYDVSLEGKKQVVVQYKAMRSSGSFTFDFDQLWLLLVNFPKADFPYVFLSGSIADSNSVLKGDHAISVNRYESFDRVFFIDAWEVLNKLVQAVAPGSASVNVLQPFIPGVSSQFTLAQSHLPGGTPKFISTINKSANIRGRINVATGLSIPSATGPSKITPPFSATAWGTAFVQEISSCNFGLRLGGADEREDKGANINEGVLHPISSVACFISPMKGHP
ncbi:hypothetical protein JH314_07320 [Xanthomonas campestris]|uniref:Uncharacterized protein n=1 Tax=Xanthomonas hortorum pv. hederae TaxID=453603 RepID=A0A9X4BV08_9XANT|nr:MULTISPECIES: hypothetical protein [Xanthomonas]MDC8640085.1 hypothetical protein [Xanthomonas hortorum pv. hederae]WDJ03215.1 hypothetical protein JH314_07320 [Xanthomonas campestris]